MVVKLRLDILLVERGLFPSREKAKTSIMAGLIRVNGELVDKAGSEIPADALVDVISNPVPYVSRGGLKLKKAVEEYKLDLKGSTLMDIGASTGGFTDCALQHGAARVYAVDVGYGQLDWKLRQDSRVVNLERTNIRYLDNTLIENQPDIVTVDVSFISLTKVLPKVGEILGQGGRLVALIKPQFEAGRSKVGKKGVVRDPDVHREVIEKVLESARDLGFKLQGLTFSPVKGPNGNIEYLAYFLKGDLTDIPVDVKATVKQAFGELSS